MVRLKSIVQLSTDDGSIASPERTPIQFGVSYGNRYDLVNEFPGYSWAVLSDEYLREVSSSSDRKKLRQFFSELGVTDFLLPVNPWTCEQFDSLVATRSTATNKKLFLALQDYWLKLNDDDERKDIMHSTFFEHARQLPWIPSLSMSFSFDPDADRIVSTVHRQLSPANQLYLRTKQTERLFGEHVPYLDIDIDFNSSLATDLGRRRSSLQSIASFSVLYSHSRPYRTCHRYSSHCHAASLVSINILHVHHSYAARLRLSRSSHDAGRPSRTVPYTIDHLRPSVPIEC